MNVRITKYNPVYRSSDGAYMYDDWTCFSELRRKKMPIEEYIAAEDGYVYTIIKLLESIGVDELCVDFLQMVDEGKDNELSNDYNSINEGLRFAMDGMPDDVVASSKEMAEKIWLSEKCVIGMDEIEIVIRLTLRNVIDVKLSGVDNTYVHFGWDYYIYFGSDRLPRRTQFDIPKGIFIEWWPSPYLDTDEE